MSSLDSHVVQAVAEARNAQQLSGGYLSALVLIVALTAAALVLIVWLSGQPSGPSRSERLLDKVLAMPPALPSFVVSTFPVADSHRCDDTDAELGRCASYRGHPGNHVSTAYGLWPRP